MTSLAVAKLIIDGLLLISLIFVAFRVLNRQQPGTIANLTKLKELESSLKEVVRDADDAGRNLSDELLGRKRDLEKLLSEVEGVEVRFNKSKNSTEEQIENASLIEKRLSSLIIKASESLNNQEQSLSRINTASLDIQNLSDVNIQRAAYIAEEQKRLDLQAHRAAYTAEEQKRHEQLSKIGRDVFGTKPLERYNKIAEPPSFSAQIQNQKSLREQIVVEQSNYDSENFVNKHVHKTLQTQNEFSKDPQPLETPENQLRKDPRLGVLGALNRESNLF